jgi:hypothetical protein
LFGVLTVMVCVTAFKKKNIPIRSTDAKKAQRKNRFKISEKE